MSETKWTPGPWTWDAALDHNWDVQVWSSPNSRVCFVAHDGENGNPTGQANARLIASAPDLYEALAASELVMTALAAISKHMLEPFVSGAQLTSALVAARAALAKARGDGQ